jgi:hypothetical protein
MSFRMETLTGTTDVEFTINEQNNQLFLEQQPVG